MPIENTESTFKLQDRTAILTGPCNSINQAIASKLTQMGVNVAMIDRNTDRSSRFANQLMDMREIQESYGRAVAIQSELAKPQQIQDAIGRAAESFGGIDIYIDGLMTAENKPFKDPTTLEDFDRVMETNLRAPIMIAHGVLRFLESRKRGRMIFLMHDLSRVGNVNNSLIAACRTGLSAFARSVARETAAHNITVNCIAAGVSEEFLLAQNPKEQVSIQEAHQRLLKVFPAAAMTEPERIANLVAFLASPLGAGVTGQTIAASPGMS
jgi:NAD(P)-dependent dehydrogenase (short-subunit alcohol dehydrogenase family)